MSLDTATALTQIDALLAGRPVPEELRRWLDAQRRAAGELVFAPAGTDATATAIWLVGRKDAPRRLVANGDGVRMLWLLVSAGATGVAISQLTEVRSGAEAVRQSLKRGRDEIERSSPELAAELLHVTIMRDLARYLPTAASPSIDTNAKPTQREQQPAHPRIIDRRS